MASQLDLPPPPGGLALTRADPRHGPAQMERAVVVLTLLLVPLAAYSGSILGFRPTGWAWLILLDVGVLVALINPISVSGAKNAGTYLAFLTLALISLSWTIDLGGGIQTLGQFATPVVVYLVARRVFQQEPRVWNSVGRLARLVLPVTILVFVISAWEQGGVRGTTARPAAIALTILLLLGTVGTTQTVGRVLFVVVLGFALLTGGRMASAVVLLLGLFLPQLRLDWRRRLVVLVIASVGLVLFSQTEAFQQRWFVGRQQGSIEDIVGLEANFNTAGRLTNWPKIAALCNANPLMGHGIGASGDLTLEATLGRTPHPHNDYLRTYCDTGLLGSLLFWGFFIGAVSRALGVLRRSDREVGVLALLAVSSLFMYALSDNVVIYTIQFMSPLALILAKSDALAMHGHRIGGRR